MEDVPPGENDISSTNGSILDVEDTTVPQSPETSDLRPASFSPSRIDQLIDSVSATGTWSSFLMSPPSSIAGDVALSINPSTPSWCHSSTAGGGYDVDFLWHHFTQRTAKALLCWDPTESSFTASIQDPYATVLPAMALNSLSLRYAALALSAFHYTVSNMNLQGNMLARTGASWGLAASRALLPPRPWTLQPNSQHFLNTVTSVGLLVLAYPEVYVDLLPLGRSAAACFLGSQDRGTKPDDQCSVALMLLIWCDISAQCSMRPMVQLSEDRIHRILESYAEEDDTYCSRIVPNWTIHPLFAFSKRFVYPLMRTARLVRLRQQLSKCEFSNTKYRSQVEELRTRLAQARDADIEARSEGAQDEDALLQVSEAYYAATQLLFHTRLEDEPWTSPFVRDRVKLICENACLVKPTSRVSIAASFPLFIAGCETVDVTIRDRIVHRLGRLPGYWSHREESLIQCLEHVWEVRDKYPGASWRVWVRQGYSHFSSFW